MLNRLVFNSKRNFSSTFKCYTKAMQKFDAILSANLKDIEAQGLYKRERVITSPQDAEITIQRGDKQYKVLNFCANNYLGLSNNKQLIDASIETSHTHGLGMSSVRFICGTQVRRHFVVLFFNNFQGHSQAVGRKSE